MEFTDKKYHVDENNYVDHSPGFLDENIIEMDFVFHVALIINYGINPNKKNAEINV